MFVCSIRNQSNLKTGFIWKSQGIFVINFYLKEGNEARMYYKCKIVDLQNNFKFNTVKDL